jgi:hypothetical protein
MQSFLFAVTLGLTTGCASVASIPEVSARHPASPQAAEVPPPPRSDVLATDERPAQGRPASDRPASHHHGHGR